MGQFRLQVRNFIAHVNSSLSTHAFLLLTDRNATGI
jgi:hypothetical protein